MLKVPKEDQRRRSRSRVVAEDCEDVGQGRAGGLQQSFLWPVFLNIMAFNSVQGHLCPACFYTLYIFIPIKIFVPCLQLRGITMTRPRGINHGKTGYLND